MNITLLTTTKPLTRSIVSQLPTATTAILAIALQQPRLSILGYVQLTRDSYYIIKSDAGLYYKLPKLSWKGDMTNSTVAIAGKRRKRFITTFACTNFILLTAKLSDLEVPQIFL